MRFDQDSFAHPLAPESRLRAASLLATGRPVYVGQVFLSVDLESGIIWGTDPYGCDSIASWTRDELGVRRALKWAEAAHQTDWHPAEGWSFY